MNEYELIEIIKREIEKYYLKTEANSKKTIGFLGKDMVLKDHLENIFKIEETADKIVVSELAIKNLAEITHGTYSTDEGKKLLYYILEGKELILAEEGIEWRSFPLIPPKLQEKYREYEKILEMYGVKILKRIEIKEYLEGKKDSYNGRVLDLRTLKNNFSRNEGYIEISTSTTVTELAKEYAAANNIKITKR
ncbi:hypothetical protein [Fusobacterium ulcerans]|uniref:hypothetical protein n=1 Tax=Fusobacterium ulcerans TaxID=861 RepID=UPI001032D014|nr:hypothetical protein [Fusobacterium ulcerans]